MGDVKNMFNKKNRVLEYLKFIIQVRNREFNYLNLTVKIEIRNLLKEVISKW